MKKFEYQFTIGLFDKDSKKQEIGTAEAREIIKSMLLNDFSIYAFTMLDCFGCYKHENGEIVQEPSIRLEIVTEKNSKKIMVELKKALQIAMNQESIMYKAQKSNIKF